MIHLSETNQAGVPLLFAKFGELFLPKHCLLQEAFLTPGRGTLFRV